MAQIIQDNFNSYNDGDLNGQGGWSGATNFDIQGTVVQEGAKAVVSTGSSITGEMVKSFTAVADGSIRYYFRTSGTTSRTYVALFTDSTLLCWVRFEDSPVGQVSLNGVTGAPINIGTYAANTWYPVDIEWRSSDFKVRARFNDGAWSSWLTTNNSWTTINKIDIASDVSSTSNYWDNITSSEITDTGKMFLMF